MKNVRYSYLKDEFALDEIRKHKWIESEKAGCEIGFATAAVDWIKKHGEQWLQFRNAAATSEEMNRDTMHLVGS